MKHYEYSYSGDTIINLKSFKKIFLNAGGLCAGGGFVGALFDDTILRKVFFIPFPDSVEQTLYDFTLNVGDTINGYFGGGAIKSIFLDRGYRGPKKIGDTELHTPKPDKNITASKRKRHKRRAAIEPVIGHLKHDYRMIRNYLKGTAGDAINVMMAAAAMNFKRIMNKWKEDIFLFLYFIVNLFKTQSIPLRTNQIIIWKSTF